MFAFRMMSALRVSGESLSNLFLNTFVPDSLVTFSGYEMARYLKHCQENASVFTVTSLNNALCSKMMCVSLLLKAPIEIMYL